LTLDLSGSQPVEMISRFGPLGSVTHTLTPDDGQLIAYQFKHEYGTVVVTCERTDAALLIDGTELRSSAGRCSGVAGQT
jgi:hypothetical protein